MSEPGGLNKVSVPTRAELVKVRQPGLAQEEGAGGGCPCRRPAWNRH